MNPYDFVHLALLALGGEIQGKTKLQKTMYFIAKLTGDLENMGFKPHYYGPYSEDVTQAVERLKALGFLFQEIINTGYVDIKGFEIARQDFKLTPEGRAIAENKTKQYSQNWSVIEEAVFHLKAAGDLDYMKMSIAAKTDLLINQNKNASVEELGEQAKQLGWNPSSDEIQESISFLQKLNLVQ